MTSITVVKKRIKDELFQWLVMQPPESYAALPTDSRNVLIPLTSHPRTDWLNSIQHLEYPCVHLITTTHCWVFLVLTFIVTPQLKSYIHTSSVKTSTYGTQQTQYGTLPEGRKASSLHAFHLHQLTACLSRLFKQITYRSTQMLSLENTSKLFNS